MVSLWDHVTVEWWAITLASMVVLVVLCLLRTDPVIPILDFSTQENFSYVNHTNVFATRPMVTINERRNINMPAMRISRDFDKFVHMVQQFTCL